MKRVFFAFILVIAVSITALVSATAQDVFLKPHKSQNPKQEAIIDQPTTNPVTPQQTDDLKRQKKDRTFANEYYKNCIKQDHPSMDKNSMGLFCACTSAKLKETMNYTEFSSTIEDTAFGQQSRDKLLVQVYAPCIEYPTASLIKSGCLKDPNIGNVISNPAQICSCIGDKVASYVRQNAPSILAQSVKNGSTSNDPMAIFTSSPEFQRNTQQYLLACIQQHGL